MHLVMFDIDGTLVDSMGFETDLYVEAVRNVLNVEIDRDWNRYEHVSDSGILDEVLRTRRIAGKEALAARVQQRFVQLLTEFIERSPAAVREIPGARRLVERLCKTPGVRVAIATGGWEPTALMKLEHIGIDVGELGFASSSDARPRTEIMRIATRRAMQGAAFRRATYFGDGAWDLRASTELGYDFVAVGGAVAHSQVCADLSDTDAILARLGLARAVASSAG